MWRDLAKGRWGFLGLLIGCLALATPAGATPFTLNSAVAFSDGTLGISGQILPVLSLNGPSSCLTGAGTCLDSTAQDWMIFRVQLDSTSNAVDDLSGAVPGVSAVGAGHFNDPDATPTSGQLFGGSGRYLYGSPNVDPSNLKAGETSDRLFVTYTAGSLPGAGLFPVFPAGTTQFMIGLAGGTDFPVTVPSSLVEIPEPSSLALLAGGFAGLVALSSRLRRRS